MSFKKNIIATATTAPITAASRSSEENMEKTKDFFFFYVKIAGCASIPLLFNGEFDPGSG